MAQFNTFALVVAAVVGGLVGAVLMVAAYFVGVGLVGAGLVALLLESGWQMVRHREPPVALLVIVAVLGALLALSVARYVVIFGTALGGSWTSILGGLSLAASRLPAGAGAPGGLRLYPLEPAPNRWWFYIAWLVLALVGAFVQLTTTTKLAAKKVKKA